MNEFDYFGLGYNGFWIVIVGIACNVSCALLGCYLVLRRLSLIGDAISHGVLPGIALAFVLSGQISGWLIIFGAMLFGILTAFLTQTVASYGKVPEDASLGVVYTSLFALGVVIINKAASNTHLDPDCVLYGEIEWVPLHTFQLAGLWIPHVLQSLGPVLLITILFVVVLWKEMKIVSFDPALAQAMGYNATLLHYLLMGLVAAVTVASFEAVGSILVIAMLIVPGATAHLLTDRLSRMMIYATIVAILSSLFGYLGAAWLETSTASMMAVVAGLQFTLAVFLAPQHGLISKGYRNIRLSLRIWREDMLALLYRAEEKETRVTTTQLREVAPKLWAGVALSMLRWKKLISVESQQRATLTEKGRQVAQSIVRSHRLWEAFLEEELQLPLDHLHEPAHAMEHFISPDLQSELESRLSQSDTDPHGRSIPPAKGSD